MKPAPKLIMFCGLFSYAIMHGLHAQPAKQPQVKEIDPKVLTAWRESPLLARSMWYLHDGDGFVVGLARTRPPGYAVLPGFNVSRIKTGVIKSLPSPSSPFAISFATADVVDTDIKELAGLTNLECLDLLRTRVTDACLKDLAPLKNLRSLKLVATKVTRLKGLSSVGSLQVLDVAATKVGDEAMGEIAKLKNLRVLDLSNTEITDAGAAPLAALRELRSLRLAQTKVADDGLKQLVKCQRLEVLDLSLTKGSNVGVKELANLKNLRTLSLFGFGDRLTNDGVLALKSLRNLRHLKIGGTFVSNKAVDELRNALPELKISR